MQLAWHYNTIWTVELAGDGRKSGRMSLIARSPGVAKRDVCDRVIEYGSTLFRSQRFNGDRMLFEIRPSWTPRVDHIITGRSGARNQSQAACSWRAIHAFPYRLQKVK